MVKLHYLNEKEINKNCHGIFVMLSLENTIELFLINVLFLLFSVHKSIVKTHVLFLCLEIITKVLVFFSSFIGGKKKKKKPEMWYSKVNYIYLELAL